MKDQSRRHLGALTVATAMVALAACSPSSSSGSAGDSKNATLTVWSWRTEDTAAYNAIFDVYEKEHPGIKVEFKPSKATDYDQILMTGLAGSKGPDVAQVRSYGQLQPTIKSKNLLPLDGIVDLSSWDAKVVSSAKGKEDGKLYAVPLARQTLQMYYNKELFAQHKLTSPTTWTWAEFIAANDKLKKASVTPLAVGAKDEWTLPILHQVLAAPRFGGTAFETAVLSGKKSFNDPDWVASVDVINQMKPYLPKGVTAVSQDEAKNLFTQGKTAMFPGGSFELGSLQKQNPTLKMGVFQVPAPTGSPSMDPTTSGYVDGSFGISARSESQAASKELVKWMATKEFGQLVADKVKQLSAVPGVSYSDPLLAQMSENYTKNPTPYLLLVDFRYGQPWGTARMGTGVKNMLLDEMTATEASADLHKGVSAWFKPAK
jgi:raffinose/stachyose/melibiose transport system substrate-binding protein